MILKHIAKHNDKKVVIIFREVPGEDHMALVVYPEILPTHFHQAIMRVLESEQGQQAEHFGEVLFRELLPDGRQILPTLHKEGMIKKVQTNQVTVTPNAKSTVRLDELNRILNQLRIGDAAKEKMEELDLNSGLVTRNRNPQAREPVAVDVLTDDVLAKQRIEQAAKMEAEATAMIEESKRLRAEAYSLDSTLKPKQKRASKKNDEQVQ
jgi:hypothetical protein